MIKCYVVDDEPASIEILSDYINKTPGLTLFKASTDPREAVAVLTGPETADIAFLDIDMPDINGLDLANIAPPETAVVFVTSHPQYALEAFNRPAIDYIVKPVSYKKFVDAIAKVQRRPIEGFKNDRSFFFVRGSRKGEMKSLRSVEVIVVSALDHYIQLHTGKGKYITRMSMKQIESKLSASPNFVRVHKSHLINITKITNIDGNTVFLEEGHQVIVGRSYRPAFIKLLESKTFNYDQTEEEAT